VTLHTAELKAAQTHPHLMEQERLAGIGEFKQQLPNKHAQEGLVLSLRAAQLFID
jgi:hypothetical protein